MELSRRHFSVLSTTFLAASFLERAAWGHFVRRRDAVDTWFDWARVAEGAWVASGEGGNALALASDGEWILVDTKNPGFAHALRREGERQPRTVAGESGGAEGEYKLARVINTHHHADHTGGNYAFVGAVPVLAHAKAAPRVLGQVERYKERLKSVPAQVARSDKAAAQEILKELAPLVDDLDSVDSTRFVPTELIDKNSDIKVGGRRLSLHHYGAGHTDNDLVVHVPDLNLVHTGDLLFNGRHPFVDVGAGANTPGWMASLRKVIELCDDRTVVVPGHGAVTGIEGLRTQIRYFEAARAAVREALRAGATREKAQETEIAGFASFGEQGKARVLAAVYDELKNRPGE